MTALRRVGVCIVVCMIASFFAIGFQVWYDLSTREDEVLTYTRLAMKDALVNIQTTEQEGFNYTNTKAAYSRELYKTYLTDIKSQIKDDKNMELISSFLNLNADNNSGDNLFRPIQYGMTYVDKELFMESFKKSLDTLVETNYPKTIESSDGLISFTTRAPSAITITDVEFKIDGPKIGELNLSTGTSADAKKDSIYRSIYGIDTMADMELVKNLGFGSSAINFYVYYDITVTVQWASASTNQLLTRNFFTNLADASLNALSSSNKVSSSLKYTPIVNDSQEYVYIPGDPIVYSYRYVLLN